MATPRTLLPPTRAGLELRCAALTLGGVNGCLWNESPPARRVDLHRLGPDVAVRRIESAGFAAWLNEAAQTTSSVESRQAAALAGVGAAAGPVPEDLRILEPTRLDGGSFPSPLAWAQEEWRLIWEEAAVRLAQQWEEDLQRVLADPTESYLLVGRVRSDEETWGQITERSSGSGEEGWRLDWGDVTLASAAAVVSVLPHHPLSSSEAAKVRGWARQHAGALMQGGEPEVLLRAPSPVARWLESALFSELCIRVAPAEPGDSSQVAETALVLWEPEGNGILADPRAAFEAARDVLREQPV